jgi:DNA-binding winged helix-turn-helix (wHTH) protein/tetratricopeptide (TPR) repeat protein
VYTLPPVSATKSSSRAALYRFGPYEADTSRSELRKYGLRIRLERKPWQLLMALLQQPGQLVTRDELQRALWGEDVFVDFEHGLNVAVKKLRAVLCDSANKPDYIQTVAGEGYLFVGVVEKVANPEQAPAPTPFEAIRTGLAEESPVVSSMPPGPVVTTVPSSKRRIGRWAALAVALVAIAASLAWLPKPEAVSPPGNTTVLVGAFDNSTGEPVLDGTLQFALERELSNSQFVRVISPERIQDILKLMRRPLDTRLDRALAMNICRRTDTRMLITGRVQKIGSQYLLTAEVIDPANGTRLRAEEAQASKQDEILAALHRLSAQVRRAVGETIPALPESLPSLEQVTTTSLHALQLYSEADDLMIRRGPGGEDIINLLRRALAEDTDFASAHIMLAHVLNNMDRFSEAAPHFERALALADTTSDRERLFIIGTYHLVKSAAPGDPSAEKAMAALEELLRHYSDDFWATNSLEIMYARAGRTHEALMLRLRKAELRPESSENRLPNLWETLTSRRETAAADRLVTLCTRQLEVPQCGEMLITRDSRPIWQQLRAGHPEEALRLTRQLAQQYSQLNSESAQFLDLALADAYLDMGKFQLAEELAARSQDSDVRFINPVLIAVYRNDRAAESTKLTELVQQPDLNGPSVVMLFADLGQFREARAEIEIGKKEWPPQQVQLGRGYLELAKGDLQHSIRHLREGNAWYKKLHTEKVARVSDHLATALERAGQVDQALNVLIDAETYLASQGDRDLVDHYNLITRLHLARLYRQTAQIAAAEAVEGALRSQLQLADSNHVVVQALKQTPGPYQAAGVH